MNEIIKKNGITYGIVLGILSILITTMMYAFDMELFGSIMVGLGILLINVVVYCILLSKTKKQLNNEFTFKQAFTTFFICMAISMVMSTAFNLVLFNVIDPGAKETIKEISIKSATSMMEKFGAPEAEIDKAVEEIRKTDNFAPAKLLMSFAISLIVGSIIGLIFAAIFKSRPNYRE